MHIKDFETWHVIRLPRRGARILYVTRSKKSDDLNPPMSTRLDGGNSLLSRRFIRASFCFGPRFHVHPNTLGQRLSLATSRFLALTQEGSLVTDSSISTRHSPISRKRRNSLKTNDGKISNRGQNAH